MRLPASTRGGAVVRRGGPELGGRDAGPGGGFAGLGIRQQVTAVLPWVQAHTRLAGTSATWGVAWTLFLCGDWVHAEALLHAARKQRPAEPTPLAMLAICQARRGKLLSAILTAREVCTPEPPTKEHAKLLINLLLDGGFLREAQARLEKLKGEWSNDADLAFAMVRLNLLRRRLDEAEHWAEETQAACHGAPYPRPLRPAYETARQGGQATAHYEQALAAGHYPEALLGLGRLAAAQNRQAEAESHCLAALNLNRPLARGAWGRWRSLAGDRPDVGAAAAGGELPGLDRFVQRRPGDRPPWPTSHCWCTRPLANRPRRASKRSSPPCSPGCRHCPPVPSAGARRHASNNPRGRCDPASKGLSGDGSTPAFFSSLGDVSRRLADIGDLCLSHRRIRNAEVWFQMAGLFASRRLTIDVSLYRGGQPRLDTYYTRRRRPRHKVRGPQSLLIWSGQLNPVYPMITGLAKVSSMETDRELTAVNLGAPGQGGGRRGQRRR